MTDGLLSEQIKLLGGALTIPGWVIAVVFLVIFLYIIVYALLQVRQIRLLQQKVSTDIDVLLRSFTYSYFLLQVLIFVVVVLIIL